MQNKERNSQKYGCGVKSQTELVCRCALNHNQPNPPLTPKKKRKKQSTTHPSIIILIWQRYEQTEMKLYFMPSSTGRLNIPESRMINCEGMQAPNKMQRNLRSTAMIYETTKLMPVLCPPISLTDEVRSHYKLKAAGIVCYSEVTYHSNSRYKKGQKYGGWKWRKDEAALTPAQHQIRRAMKFSCRMKINHMRKAVC